MGQRSKGQRSRSRKLLAQNRNNKGITFRLRELEVGDSISVRINSTFLKGAPHRRFQGLTGIVRRKQGRAYVISFPFLSKCAISTIEHLF